MTLACKMAFCERRFVEHLRAGGWLTQIARPRPTGQRGSNEQPAGRAAGSGGSPGIAVSRLRRARSGRGMAASRASV